MVCIGFGLTFIEDVQVKIWMRSLSLSTVVMSALLNLLVFGTKYFILSFMRPGSLVAICGNVLSMKCSPMVLDLLQTLHVLLLAEGAANNLTLRQGLAASRLGAYARSSCSTLDLSIARGGTAGDRRRGMAQADAYEIHSAHADADTSSLSQFTRTRESSSSHASTRGLSGWFGHSSDRDSIDHDNESYRSLAGGSPPI